MVPSTPGDALSHHSLPRGEPPHAIATQTISGTVIDGETNEPMPGVNVLAKGTTMGTVTDVEGAYQIALEDEVTTLVFSSIGYLSETVSIDNRSTIDMVLIPDIASLDEVVVVGYGTKEKRDITTSISSIDAEKVTQTVALSPELAMQGRMTGVQVSGNNGNPFTPPYGAHPGAKHLAGLRTALRG